MAITSQVRQPLGFAEALILDRQTLQKNIGQIIG
jgi:hypothetical protein